MDIDSLLQFDSNLLLSLNGSNSQFVDGWMMTLTTGYTWIPLYIALFYLIVKNSETMGQIALVVACTGLCLLLADGGADGIAKPLVARFRPCNDPVIGSMVSTVDNYRASGLYGFFSAHAANTASIALFFSLLVRSNLLSVSLLIWSLINCYTRIYLGVHYPLDVFVGIIWGLCTGGIAYAVYYRMRRFLSKSNNFISDHYTSTGFCTEDIDVVILTLIVTLIYTIIRAVYA